MMDEQQAYTVKDEERAEENARLLEEYKAFLDEHFSERDLRLIENCRVYAENDPAGLPGHNLMIIVAKLADMVGIYSEWSDITEEK